MARTIGIYSFLLTFALSLITVYIEEIVNLSKLLCFGICL